MALGARRTSFWCLILVPLAVLCSVVDLSSSGMSVCTLRKTKYFVNYG